MRALIATRGCAVTAVPGVREADDEVLLGDIDAVVITEAGSGAADEIALRRFLTRLDTKRIGALLLAEQWRDFDAGRMGLCRAAPTNAPAEELWGRLNTLIGIRPWVDRVEGELDRLQTLGATLNEHFLEVDQEMRLASRLQRDFLPREMPRVGPVRFAALYRPASWVSGDIYDVFRIDDRHLAFYLADAVGHGIAAGLLTMFVKYALLRQRVGDHAEIARVPAENIRTLNETLLAQQLQNCQFVTACYCVLDTETLTLSVSRGGHPYPIHVHRDGTLAEIESTGALLGVFPDQEFGTATVQLAPGDKVLLFSDGVELAFGPSPEGADVKEVYERQFRAVSHLPAEEMVEQLGQTIDCGEGSLNPGDDVTLVVVEVEG